MARKIAVEYLRQRPRVSEVYVRLAYAIGVAEPVEATVMLDGLAESVVGYDLTPTGIINTLHLWQPVYEQTALYGHFGRSFIWE